MVLVGKLLALFLYDREVVKTQDGRETENRNRRGYDMPKIDLTQFENYKNLSAEEKLQLLESFEYDDGEEKYKKTKEALDKATKEAGDWRKKYNGKLTEDEKKKAEDDQKIIDMQTELDQLKAEKTKAEYYSQFVAQGYTEELAKSSAEAMAKGDMATVFANNKTFAEALQEKAKSEKMHNTPKPQPGERDDGTVDYTKLKEEAMKEGRFADVAYYTRLEFEANKEQK